MIPYGRQDINQDDINTVVEVLQSDFVTQGPKIPEFERVVAKYTGATHGVAVDSATSDLHIACVALDVAAGDLVRTSPNTLIASDNCAFCRGLDFEFLDIDRST